MIDLYAAGTSNGMRARIALEECGLKYNWHPIDLTKGEHKTPQYLAMNPMGQIPVLIDDDAGGKKVTMAQSSAIMMYCAEKAGKFIPKDPAKKAAMLEAYMSASTDITPMFGAVNACVRAKDPQPHAVSADMFKQRLKGYFKVWDDLLAKRKYAGGDVRLLGAHACVDRAEARRDVGRGAHVGLEHRGALRRILRDEFPGLLGAIHHDGARLRQRDLGAARALVVDDHRNGAVRV